MAKLNIFFCLQGKINDAYVTVVDTGLGHESVVAQIKERFPTEINPDNIIRFYKPDSPLFYQDLIEESSDYIKSIVNNSLYLEDIIDYLVDEWDGENQIDLIARIEDFDELEYLKVTEWGEALGDITEIDHWPLHLYLSPPFSLPISDADRERVDGHGVASEPRFIIRKEFKKILKIVQELCNNDVYACGVSIVANSGYGKSAITCYFMMLRVSECKAIAVQNTLLNELLIFANGTMRSFDLKMALSQLLEFLSKTWIFMEEPPCELIVTAIKKRQDIFIFHGGSFMSLDDE
ncbi:hypothetical protein M422DRAFT_274510 [Sphaerobolus stellatus SS14]|uniref:Uncharacterized protein n=1 Tax=Sphaerobolus stellatus (strain SS14) TaxID=990650 RepID=A0A0C9TRX4_SPHS4|nr:hypothetical protein M422DRAFT_274510 [Sphaerobolus stellatus SS14]